MKSVYVRENLTITEFDKEDVIATSGVLPTEAPTDPPVAKRYEKENSYRTFGTFDGKGSWF